MGHTARTVIILHHSPQKPPLLGDLTVLSIEKWYLIFCPLSLVGLVTSTDKKWWQVKWCLSSKPQRSQPLKTGACFLFDSPPYSKSVEQCLQPSNDSILAEWIKQHTHTQFEPVESENCCHRCYTYIHITLLTHTQINIQNIWKGILNKAISKLVNIQLIGFIKCHLSFLKR